MKFKNLGALNITKTQSYIVSAFLYLLQRYKFEEITVTRICQDANVARVTFYRNFQTKEDILRLYIRMLVDDYFSKIKDTGNFDHENLARSYFKYWREESDLIELLNKNDISSLLLDEFSSAKPYLSDIRIENSIVCQLELTEVGLYYFHAYNHAGLWRLIFLWNDRNYRESIEEMTSIFLKCINPNIKL